MARTQGDPLPRRSGKLPVGAAWAVFTSAVLGGEIMLADRSTVHSVGVESKEQMVQRIVDQKIQFYNNAFREILLVQLPGGGSWLESALAFKQLLGQEATNPDYEHPPEAREDLLYVSTRRVLFMLQANASSSALFRVGTEAAAKRTHLCVITLDPAAVARDDATATSHLLDCPPKMLARIPKALRLNHRDYLQFVIDHEAFHCIDALYNGPIPMSEKEYWGQYMMFRNEHGGDAYAIAVHIARHGRVTPFVENLTRIRSLCLFNAAPEHLTRGALRAVADLDPATLAGAGPREVLAVADRVREQVVPDYPGYLAYRAAACRVMDEIGVPLDPDDHALCTAAEPSDAWYKDLARGCRKGREELFGDPGE